MNRFEEIIKNFFSEITALEGTMPLLSTVFNALEHFNHKKFGEYLKKHCIILENINESSYKFSVPESEFTRYSNYNSQLEELKIANKIFPRMYITTIICQFDAYIGNLISNVLQVKPQILNSSDRTLTFEQISTFENIETAKKYLIEKEVESVLRCSHNDHISWFEKKLSINLRSDQSLIGRFIEITERRNIFTHNNGVVNESYLLNCKKHNCCCNSIKLGDELTALPDYYSQSIDTIIEIGIKIGHIIWRNIEKDHYDRTEISINNIAYELIKREKYDLAINLIEFTLTNYKSFTSSANRLLLIINQAQCYFWKQEKEKVSEILKYQDWSLCTPDYLISKYTLEEKYDDAILLLGKLNDDSLIDKNALIDWPIFKELRKTEQFKKYFEDKYGKTIEEVFKEVSPDLIQAKFEISAIEDDNGA